MPERIKVGIVSNDEVILALLTQRLGRHGLSVIDLRGVAAEGAKTDRSSSNEEQMRVLIAVSVPDFERTKVDYEAALQALQGGAKWIALSSAEPPMSWLRDKGDRKTLEQDPEWITIFRRVREPDKVLDIGERDLDASLLTAVRVALGMLQAS